MINEICPTCHLPKSICTCGARSKESQHIKIAIQRKKFKKFVTTISGFSSLEEGKDIEKFLKKKLACGGTLKNNIVEIQGSQKDKVKLLLVEKGYLQEFIDA